MRVQGSRFRVQFFRDKGSVRTSPSRAQAPTRALVEGLIEGLGLRVEG